MITDDDLQHSPSDIFKLYSKFEEDFDICFANFRYKKQAFWKNIGSWLKGKIANTLLKKHKLIYLRSK